MAVYDIAARAGLIDDMQAMPLADETAQCPIQRGQVAADGANMPNFAVAVFVCDSDIDGIFMDIQPNKQNARLLHGSSPIRKSDGTGGSIMWLGVVYSTQPTIRLGTGHLNSSHSV